MPNNEPLRTDQRENHAKPLPVRPALCTHIMPSGATCGSCAVSGTPFCYHHSAVKTALGEAANASNIPFIFPEDRASLQINYFLLLQAYTQRRIDLRTFNSMQRLLRSMDANLGKMPLDEDRAQSIETRASDEPCQSVPTKQTAKQPTAHQVAANGKPQPLRPDPATQNSVSLKSHPSFEEIAAQHKPLQSECFLIATDKHPARFADVLTR